MNNILKSFKKFPLSFNCKTSTLGETWHSIKRILVILFKHRPLKPRKLFRALKKFHSNITMRFFLVLPRRKRDYNLFLFLLFSYFYTKNSMSEGSGKRFRQAKSCYQLITKSLIASESFLIVSSTIFMFYLNK